MKIIIANWKANPSSLPEAQDLFRATVIKAEQCREVETVVCPPFVYLEELAKWLFANFSSPPLALGVQDIWESAGPFTGEISPEMARNLGAQYVLVGHSDRRYILGEDDVRINKKVLAALRIGLTPVLFVGEKERGGDDDQENLIVNQLLQDLADVGPARMAKVLVCYEPVWAISTSPGSHPDTPANALKAAETIRRTLLKYWNIASARVLYGGSVSADNITRFLEHPEINGAVVGGASLRAEAFGHILKLSSQL